jgi:phenylacetate-coenzyme A ligase PaaK-like adenylate-forming protein
MSLTPLEPWIARKIGAGDRLRRADLERYQLGRLRETLRHARSHSPFYRAHLADAPDDLGALDDLARLPFTTPQDVRNNPLRFLCVSQDAIHRIVTLDSSGTTGEPKRIAFTRGDQELTLDFFHIGMSTFTAAGDTVLILLPGTRPGSVGDLLATALPRLGARPIVHGPVVDARAALEAIEREQVDVVVGMPVQALLLARHPAGRSLKLRSVLLTADHVPRAIAAAVERAWGCRVYNHYGMTEMGLGGGVDCRARRGYHVREADLLFEIVNPASGQPVADGEMGEIVFTTLTRRGMPLIRYRTGDLSRFIPGGCPCGTALKTLEHVRRRLIGAVRLGDCGTISMAGLDEALFPIERVVDFSAAIARGERDRLQIDVMLVPDSAGDVRPAVEDALDRIPAIRSATRAGQIDVVVTIRLQTTTTTPRLAKRIIAEHG